MFQNLENQGRTQQNEGLGSDEALRMLATVFGSDRKRFAHIGRYQ